MAIWLTILPALISGAVAAALVPFVQQRFIWRNQKRIEFRRAAFDEALNALAMYEADAYSPSLQSTPAVAHGMRRHVELRDATATQMQRARYLVRAFFPAATAAAFETALNTHICLQTIPDTKFGELANTAVARMAADIGLADPTGPLFDRWPFRRGRST